MTVPTFRTSWVCWSDSLKPGRLYETTFWSNWDIISMSSVYVAPEGASSLVNFREMPRSGWIALDLIPNIIFSASNQPGQSNQSPVVFSNYICLTLKYISFNTFNTTISILYFKLEEIPPATGA